MVTELRDMLGNSENEGNQLVIRERFRKEPKLFVKGCTKHVRFSSSLNYLFCINAVLNR